MEVKISKWTMITDSLPEWYSQYHWQIHQGYAQGQHKKTRAKILFHRKILGLNKGDKKIVDHINRNRLDNRIENLRLVNWTYHLANRTTKLGLNRCITKVRTKFRVQMEKEGIRYDGGKYFSTIEEARLRVKEMQKELYGMTF